MCDTSLHHENVDFQTVILKLQQQQKNNPEALKALNVLMTLYQNQVNHLTQALLKVQANELEWKNRCMSLKILYEEKIDEHRDMRIVLERENMKLSNRLKHVEMSIQEICDSYRAKKSQPQDIVKRPTQEFLLLNVLHYIFPSNHIRHVAYLYVCIFAMLILGHRHIAQ